MMRQTIGETGFGYIVVNGTRCDHDVVLSPKGNVKKRKKRISKAIHGSGHTVAREELAAYLEGKECTLLIVGTGQNGILSLSDEARAYLDERGIPHRMQKTPDAIEAFNEATGKRRALIHVTC